MDAGIPMEAWPIPFAGAAMMEELYSIEIKYDLMCVAEALPATGAERHNAGQIISSASRLATALAKASPAVQRAFRDGDGEPIPLGELQRLATLVRAAEKRVAIRLGGLSKEPSAAPAPMPLATLSAHDALLSELLPKLYENTFPRSFTHHSTDPGGGREVQHTEGVHFVAAAAAMVLKREVTHQAVISAIGRKIRPV